MTLIEDLAGLLVAIGPESVPPQALQDARRCLLDALGCGLYGASLPEGRAAVAALAQMSGTGPDADLPADTAALAGGFLCHLRELDDVHYAILHPGAVCVPAALAVADRVQPTLGDVLWALVAGYEAMARVAKGQNYLNHRKLGWHGTGTCGPFGAATAVSRLLKLDHRRLAWALGLAGSRTGGTWAFAVDGAMSKRLHPGLAARDGVTAAYLAQGGITGPLHVLEADDGGFYQTTSEGWDLVEVTRGWGEEWAISATEFKWYAACKSAHAAIEAARIIHRKATTGAALGPQIRKIRVEVNSTGYAMAGRGYRLDSVTSAQLSIPFGVAVALSGGEGDIGDYTPEQVARPDLFELARKVEVSPSEEMDRLRATQHKVPGEVTVEWIDGTTSREYVEDPKGSRLQPLTTDELVTKFRRLAGRTIGFGTADHLVDRILDGHLDAPVTSLIGGLKTKPAG
ncbi:MAG TPA: MmgE/PrpD family protein [archaeon]|nr:MmgE/PrpD family protein [archaeon]